MCVNFSPSSAQVLACFSVRTEICVLALPTDIDILLATEKRAITFVEDGFYSRGRNLGKFYENSK